MRALAPVGASRLCRGALQAAVFALFFCATLVCTSPRAPGGDARYYQVATESLARYGTLDGRATGIGVTPDRSMVGPHGELYTIFPLGPSLVQVPAYWAAIRLATSLADRRIRGFIELLGLRATPAALTAIAALLLFNLLRLCLGFSNRLSFAVACMYVFATMAFPYSKLNGAEPLQATLLIGLFYVLLRPARLATLPLLAFTAGLLVLTKPALLLVLPPFAYLLLSERVLQRSSWTSLGTALAVGLAMAAVFFYWNDIRTGSPFNTYGEFQGVEDVFVLGNLPGALRDLLLSPYKNIFLFNPVLLLAVPGFFLLGGGPYRRAWVALLLIWVVMFGSFYVPGWGVVAWGPRFMMPMLVTCMPFVAATWRWLLDRSRSSIPGAVRWASVAAVSVLLVASVYVQVLGASYDPFHVKIFRSAYNLYRQKLDLPPCDRDELRSSAVAIQQYLFWNASIDRVRGGDLPELPWLDRKFDPEVASSMFVRVRADWLMKDFLFLNLDRVAGAGVFPRLLGWALVVGAVLSFAVAVVLVWRNDRREIAAGNVCASPRSVAP